MNFDLFSQAKEKLGFSVSKLTVLRDLTPHELDFSRKDFVRSKWMYISLGKDVIKYGRGKAFPTVDLLRCWRTGNVNFYYIFEGADGKVRHLNYGGVKLSGVDPASMDERFEGRDIKRYNEGSLGGLSMLAIGVAVLTLALGIFVGVVIGPAVSGALTP